MKRLLFKPTWNTFNLPAITEAMGVNIPVPVKIKAIVSLDIGENSVWISDDDAAHLTSVKKDGITESYTISNNILSFTANQSHTAILEFERSGTISYEIIVGKLVPGIIFKSGVLKGIVGNIPHKEAHTYRFGLRAKWNGLTADVVKQWVVSPTDNQISWNTDTLPIPTTDATKIDGRPFYTIGEFKRGQLVDVEIDLYNPDATPIEVEARAVPQMVSGSNRFSGTLPLGFEIKNNPFSIGGYIPAEAVAGDYFVELFVDEPLGPTPIIIHAKLLTEGFDNFTAINRVNWITQNDLGELVEGLPSHLKVVAQNGSQAVTYRLAVGSRPLPPGMTLHPNGEIRGIVPYYKTDTSFTFSVSATSGRFAANKSFTFKIKNKFSKSGHLRVYLPLTGPTRLAWKAYGDQIDSGRRFRPSDPSFGAVQPRILLIRGLNNEPVTSLDYDQPLDLIAGPFRIARAMSGSTHVYDVIYREFFDPKDKAGGFVYDDEDVIPSPVFYPQDPSIQITEGTIRNLRNDLVTKIGLNSSKPISLGINGGEVLELWMTSPQSNGKPLGFIAAGIIDFILPNQARIVLPDLTYGSIPVGKKVAFDRMVVEQGLASYYYFLGWDRNEDELIELGKPPQPADFRVDGFDVDDIKNLHPEPVFTWSPIDADAVYKLLFYNGETLLRSEENIDDSFFFYTPLMQAADGNPGFIRAELYAVLNSAESNPSEARITLRAGWGYAWGLQYGGPSA